MLTLVFAIGEFGITFTRWNSLTNAVREGARAGVVFRSPCDAGTVTTLIETTVKNFASSSGIDPADFEPDRIETTGVCDGTGTQLTVSASVPYDFIALDVFAGFAPSMNLSARTVMRNE
jgi:Flp pilus assembly protein TadG